MKFICGRDLILTNCECIDVNSASICPRAHCGASLFLLVESLDLFFENQRDAFGYTVYYLH